MDFNTGEHGSEWRNPHVIYSHSSYPHKHNFIPQIVIGNSSVQYVCNGIMGKGLFFPPIIDQNLSFLIHRDGQTSDLYCFNAVLSHFNQKGRIAVGTYRHKGQRRIQVLSELDNPGHPSHHSVPVRKHIEEAGVVC